MLNVSQSIELSVPAERTWARVSRFEDASWVQGTKECSVQGSGVGAIRTVVTVDGARIREELLSHDDRTRRFSYSILEAPMPLRDYVSHVVVEESGVGSRLTWSCTFDAPSNMAEAIRGGLEGLFRASLESLKKSLA